MEKKKVRGRAGDDLQLHSDVQFSLRLLLDGKSLQVLNNRDD